jgi:pSer/pThr/pTyr-binding forkhead associated (FHA) protein
MNLALVVMTPGKLQGKAIPITLPQFLIGRDPQCHLRPASPMVSKRHRALLSRGKQAFVNDFNSTNGTFLNDQQVQGEVELHNGDVLKVGPITFAVSLEATRPPVDQPTPPLPMNKPAPSEEDDIAAMLLSLQDDSDSGSTGLSSEVPEGSTVMDLQSPTAAGNNPTGAQQGKGQPAQPPLGDTSSAAKAILEKYWHRPRT